MINNCSIIELLVILVQHYLVKKRPNGPTPERLFLHDLHMILHQ